MHSYAQVHTDTAMLRYVTRTPFLLSCLTSQARPGSSCRVPVPAYCLSHGGMFDPTQGPLGPTISGLSSAIVLAPQLRIVFVISSERTVFSAPNPVHHCRDSLSQTRSTPSWPWVPLAYKNGRPSPTAFAPSATALTTSAPDRTPPSIITSSLENRSGRVARSSYNRSIGAGALGVGLHPRILSLQDHSQVTLPSTVIGQNHTVHSSLGAQVHVLYALNALDNQRQRRVFLPVSQCTRRINRRDQLTRIKSMSSHVRFVSW